LCLWDLKTGETIRVLEGHEAPITCVSMDNRGRVAVSGSTDGTVRLWELVSGECLQVLAGHQEHVTSVAFGADGL